MTSPTKYIVSMGDVAPDVNSVPAGTLWFNKVSGKLFLLYQDVDSLQWIQVPVLYLSSETPPPPPPPDLVPYFSAIVAGVVNPDDTAYYHSNWSEYLACQNITHVPDLGDGTPGFVMSNGGLMARSFTEGTPQSGYMELRAFDYNYNQKWLVRIKDNTSVNGNTYWYSYDANRLTALAPNGDLVMMAPWDFNPEIVVCSSSGQNPNFYGFDFPKVEFGTIQDMQFSADGSLYIIGFLNNEFISGSWVSYGSHYLIKLNPDYSPGWMKYVTCAPVVSDSRWEHTSLCKAGNDILVGISDDNSYNRPESNSTKQKANITRYTSSGNIVFSKNYIDSTPNIPPLGTEPTITAITEGPNETAFMCGQVSRYNSQSNPQDQYDTGGLVAYVAKIDSNTGAVLKASSIDVASTYTGGAEVYELTSVSTDSLGFVYVSGTGYIETPEYDNDWGEIFILFKLNSELELVAANFVTNANGVYGIQFGKPEISGELIIVPTALGRYFRSDLPQGTESTAAAFAFKRSDIGANTVGKLASKNYGGDAIFQSEDATSYFETVPMTFEVGEQTNTLANVNITTTSSAGSLEANVIADYDIYELVSIEPPPPPMTQIIVYSDGTNTPVVTNGPSVTYTESVGSQTSGGPFGEPYFQSPFFEILGAPLGLGTGDYTVETWYRRVSTDDQRPQIITWASTREVGMNDDFAIQVWPARVEDEDQVVPPPCILVRTGGMSDFRIQKAVTLGDWRSVVVQRKNNVIEAWENGESISEVWRNVDYVEPIDFGTSTKIQMGGNPSTRGPLDIGQTRITIGTALYPSGPTITIPTAPFVDVDPGPVTPSDGVALAHYYGLGINYSADPEHDIDEYVYETGSRNTSLTDSIIISEGNFSNLWPRHRVFPAGGNNGILIVENLKILRWNETRPFPGYIKAYVFSNSAIREITVPQTFKTAYMNSIWFNVWPPQVYDPASTYTPTDLTAKYWYTNWRASGYGMLEAIGDGDPGGFDSGYIIGTPAIYTMLNMTSFPAANFNSGLPYSSWLTTFPQWAQTNLFSDLTPPEYQLGFCHTTGSCPVGQFDINKYPAPPTVLPSSNPALWEESSIPPITYNSSLPYPDDTNGPDSFVFVWDWGQPEYCRQQLLALGFSEADLTP